MSDHTLPRQERLRSLKAIRRLFGEGHSGFAYPVRYVYLLEEGLQQEGQPGQMLQEEQRGEQLLTENVVPSGERAVQAMFSVPKKFHKRANRRNLHKRRMREAYRLGRDGICERLRQSGKHLQIAFIYSTKECHSYKTISNAVQRILEQVSKAV
ncbi:MAG: ribonuclease P protein component [Alistipes sp.]|nr:ribonuclease P protein component [Alistipes sp.]MBO5399540.1 ribonuclease P protein component [Alistipes sp.]